MARVILVGLAVVWAGAIARAQVPEPCVDLGNGTILCTGEAVGDIEYPGDIIVRSLILPPGSHITIRSIGGTVDAFQVFGNGAPGRKARLMEGLMVTEEPGNAGATSSLRRRGLQRRPVLVAMYTRAPSSSTGETAEPVLRPQPTVLVETAEPAGGAGIWRSGVVGMYSWFPPPRRADEVATLDGAPGTRGRTAALVVWAERAVPSH